MNGSLRDQAHGRRWPFLASASSRAGSLYARPPPPAGRRESMPAYAFGYQRAQEVDACERTKRRSGCFGAI